MPYEVKPDSDDVILSTFEERDRLMVDISLREGDDGSGATVKAWSDEDCAQAFEEGYLKRSRVPGRLSDDDSTLLQSALEYAVEHEMPVLVDFAKRTGAAVDAVAEGLPAAYDALDAAEPADDDEDADDRRDDLIDRVAEKASLDPSLSKVSDARRKDIELYLCDSLRQALDARVTASPSP